MNTKPRHGGHGTLTYSRWKSMLQRCYTTTSAAYQYYGGRGITVCDRWRSFPPFLEDMGACPGPQMTLDRIDNHRGYEPGNCRWVSKADQSGNRRNCVVLNHDGLSLNVAQWAAKLGIPPNTIRQRLYLGWTAARALTEPLKPRGHVVAGDINKIYRRGP